MVMTVARQERQFVEMGDGLEGVRGAAIVAGYARANAAEMARQLLAMPHIRAAIRVEQSGKLATLANEVAETMHDEDCEGLEGIE